MRVSGVVIGRGFHWEQKRDLTYSGTMILRRTHTSSVLINAIKAEEYLKSVISSEMNVGAPLEYLKAHAIISRSWLMRIISATEPRMSEHISEPGRVLSYTQSDRHRLYDVCCDDHCQRYQGISAINSRVDDAVALTRGLVLTDADGRIADARFSKCCGGHTELFSTAWHDTDYSYLPAQEDPWCNPAILTDSERVALRHCLKDYDCDTDYYRWHVHVPASLIERNLREIYGQSIGSITTLEAEERGPSGRIRVLRVHGTDGVVTIGKELAIRRLLSESHLYSSAFTVTPTQDGFELHGRGWGHGVGLCQTGAALMAIRGHSAADILNFYYPVTNITSLYD